MGCCCSCREGLPDNHATKFKVTNVDDEGTELGSGIMELTQTELVLHTRKRDAVRWPYLCLRRYGYDSNLFSFESGRRCQTGQGIFAFKCSRAEEIFNLLQELMQRNSISVVEEPVIITRSGHPAEIDLQRNQQTAGALGYAGFPNGFHSFPRDGPSYPSSCHPTMGNVRHSSIGDQSTHGLIIPEDQSHTYVNTASGNEEMGGRHCMHSLPEAHTPYHEPPRNHLASGCSMEDRNPQVFLQPGEVKFVLGRAPAYSRLPMRADGFCRHHRDCKGCICSGDRDPLQPHNNNNECKDQWSTHKCAYENINGLVPPGSIALRRGTTNRSLKLTPEGLPFNSCAHRRTAMLHYENLPSLPPVWECQSLQQEDDEEEEDDSAEAMTLSLNGYHDDPCQNYMNAENTSACSSYHHHRPNCQTHRSCPSNVFSFDFRRPHAEQRQLNYIQVELEAKSESKGRQIPQITCTPAPNHLQHRADSYAVIDLKKTAAMSSLQRAMPRDDGTSRKTRHNSTDLPL
ncbi:fibroblast growth factor receptor substrate 3 [Spea bombifrons]|uniref:fibroblast growth factor receptor substrate 3 n=1 Tax=Spea bombifrons TaxID=233779 RepID=UPI002349A834|nr:fibroblast growth factor receptor substrate 3 [Spea bombifrons]XP_053310239.1 fibroblast growth factor receptor substrate 3 [Spea bombifrons]